MSGHAAIQVRAPGVAQRVHGLSTGTRHQVTVKREVIPIVFVPGIMGSRLRIAGGGKRVWDPDAKAFMGYTYPS